MANPQPSDAHLRMSHQIWEQIMVSHFTERQLRILMLILRLSWGCGKRTACIPRQKDFEIAGVGENHINEHLQALERDRVLERHGDKYAFNKNFDQWRVSRALHYDQWRLSHLVALNLRALPDSGSVDASGFPNGEDAPSRIGKTALPETGSAEVPDFPNKEDENSLKGKNSLPEKGSVPDTKSDTAKESIKESIKERSSSSKEEEKEEEKSASVGAPGDDEAGCSANTGLVFKTFEAEIGKLTPHAANQLNAMLDEYPRDWVVEAMQLARENNKCSISYFRKILTRWRTEGKDDGRRAWNGAERGTPRAEVGVVTHRPDSGAPDYKASLKRWSERNES